LPELRRLHRVARGVMYFNLAQVGQVGPLDDIVPNPFDGDRVVGLSRKYCHRAASIANP